VVAVPVALGLGAYIALHIVEPKLALTWSYAHLHRRPALPWIAGALVVLTPPAALLAWRHPAGARPLRAMSRMQVLGWFVAGLAVVGVIGFSYPTPVVSIDPVYLLQSVDKASFDNARWLLTLFAYAGLSRLLHPPLNAAQIVRGVNAVMETVALVALAGAARRLSATRREAVAITLLAWTTFGVLQLAMGYIDIYPVVLGVTALFLWSGLAAIQGRIHPAWPIAVAALGPFWYIGLVLIGPATLVIAFETVRRPGGVRRLVVAAAAAVVVAGLATVPTYGRPFAWRAFHEAAAAASGWELGLSPTSSLLPPSFMFSVLHAEELLHTMILVDGVGVLLIVVAGGWCLAGPWRRTWDPAAAFLAAVVGPCLVFAFVMDPLWGAYADWDLFCYGAAATSLLGGYAFVVWGRRCPALFPALCGLALAANGVHLLARLNALRVDVQAHMRESPYHARW
jgi:hypothetical protein